MYALKQQHTSNIRNYPYANTMTSEIKHSADFVLLMSEDMP
jgi:hypothetical protein